MSYTPIGSANKSPPPGHRRTRSSQQSRRESQLRHVTNSSEYKTESGTVLSSDTSESMTESEEHELDDIDGRLEDDEETGLSSDLRRKRSKKKRRNTHLDERFVPNLPMREQSEEEAALTRRTLVYKIMLNTLFIVLWYTFSISISVVGFFRKVHSCRSREVEKLTGWQYNKWMFKEEPGKEKVVFPYPLFTTCLHMVVQFSLASLILYCIPRLRPQSSPAAANGSTDQLSEKAPLMTRWFYLTRIGPCGAATGLDIGLGNMSLKFISLTCYTMCKSSVLGFVLLFAFLFRLEKPSWRLFAIITTMTAGVLLMVAGEVDFQVLGFVLVMSAAASSGFRWSLTQILLLRNPATSNPFSSIFFLAPIMFITLLVIAIPVEGFGNVISAFRSMADERGMLLSAGILLFPGCLAFAMTASEFALLQRTSVVTLSIAGIFKEVLTISTASMVFGDEKLTPVNLAGLVLTIITIAYYNYVKISKMNEEAKSEAQASVGGAQEYAPVLSADPDTDAGPQMNRPSTSELIRNSLSISTSDRAISKIRRGSTPPKVSPVKSPEDLE